MTDSTDPNVLEEAELVEQTDNGPRPEDGDQPDDQQHTGERTDLLPEED